MSTESRKSSVSSIDSDRDNNEINSHQYKPPRGYKLKEYKESNKLDWLNAIQDDQFDIVCLRIPDNIKTKYLKGLSLNKDGNVDIKGKHYNLISDDSKTTNKFQSGSIKNEIDNLSLLIPNNQGKLSIINKSIDQKLQLSNQIPSLATPPFDVHSSSDGALKREQPTEKLKWRFMPPGFQTKGPFKDIKEEKKDKKDKKDKKRKSIDESPTKDEKKKKHKRSDSKYK